MLTEVKALVLRTVNLGENDKLLTLFTEEYGKITAVANGSRALKSRYLAAAETFCYAQYVLYEKGDRYWVREVNLIESFFDLRADLTRISLASYIAEVADDVVEENAPEKEFLRLVLNALYALSRGLQPPEKVKAVFEFRAAAILGFLPDLSACEDCGETEGALFLDVSDGCLLCENCRALRAENPVPGENAPVLRPVTPAALSALRYVAACAPERLFAFRLEPADMTVFSETAETYLLYHLERGFKSLDYYKQMLP